MTHLAAPPDREGPLPEVGDLVERFATAAASNQILHPGYLLWWAPDRNACVAYVDTGKAWVTAGEPLAPRNQHAQVAEQFRRAAHLARRRVVFFAVEQPWFESTSPFSPWVRVPIGRQPILLPQMWPTTLRQVRSLREQLRRARSHGVVVTRATGDELKSSQLRTELATLVDRWRATKAMPPMGFLVQLHSPWRDSPQQRLWLARREGQCIGFALTLALPARRGVLLEHLIRAPSAPNGTTELLVHSVLDEARALGTEQVTLGLAPLAGTVGPALQWIRQRSSALYDFVGLERYKAKFRPQRWDNVFLCIPRGTSVPVALYDVLCAFAQGGLVEYAWRSTLRGPRIVIRGLALLLVPWALALAFCDAEYWFPVAWMRWFWVAFDLIVAASLFALGRRIDRKWGKVLSWFLLFDAAATLVLALRFNAPRVAGPLDATVILAASLAPCFAWLVVVGAVRRATRA